MAGDFVVDMVPSLAGGMRASIGSRPNAGAPPRRMYIHCGLNLGTMVHLGGIAGASGVRPMAAGPVASRRARLDVEVLYGRGLAAEGGDHLVELGGELGLERFEGVDDLEDALLGADRPGLLGETESCLPAVIAHRVALDVRRALDVDHELAGAR